MSLQYGWTYTRREQAGRTVRRNRYCKPARPAVREKTLAMNAAGSVAQRRHGVDVQRVEKIGRWIVAAGLIVITFLVLGGRQLDWRTEVSSCVTAWLQRSRPNTMARPAVPAEAKAAPAKPAVPEAAAPASARPAVSEAAAPAPAKPAVPEAAAPAPVKPVTPKVLPAIAAETSAISVAQKDDAARLPAVALISDGGLFCVNQAGRVWPLEGRMPQDLPVVTGVRVNEYPGSMGIELRSELDMGLIRRLLASGLADQFSEINLQGPAGTVLYTREGVKIMLGNDSVTLERDLKRLSAVLQDVRDKNLRIAMVDLRYDQHVVVRPEAGTKR